VPALSFRESGRRTAPHTDGLDEQIDNAIRGVKLDGATEYGVEAAYPSTPGEFAYRWNSWSDERRAAFLAHITEASEHFAYCPNRPDPLRMV
jgi:hypothetical protein